MEQFFECVLPSLNINIFSHAHQGVLFFLHSFWQLVFWRQLWCHQLIPTLPRVFDDECGIELHFSNKCTHWVLNEFSWVFFAWLAFRTSFCFQWYSSGIFFAHISSSDMKLLYVFTILLLFSECGLFLPFFFSWVHFQAESPSRSYPGCQILPWPLGSRFKFTYQ